MPRDSSRTPRAGSDQDLAAALNEASERYIRVCEEKRGGKQHNRRRKSLVLTILEYYIHLITRAAASSGNLDSYITRLHQATAVHQRVKFTDWLPLRGDPILESSIDSDLESEFAESVREIGDSDEEIEEEQEADPRSVFPWRRPAQPDHPPPGVGVNASWRPPEPNHPPPPKASPARPPGPRPVRPVEPAYPPPSWGKGSGSSSSSSSPRPKPILALSSKARPIAKAEPAVTVVEEDNNQIDWAYLDRHRVELYNHLGERVRPATRVDFGRSCVSFDYHQVLDTFRDGKVAYRPLASDHGIPQASRQVIDKVNRLGFDTVITSYVHRDFRRDAVVEAGKTVPVRFTIITRQPTGPGGKADVLSRIFACTSNTSLIHIDGKGEICTELKGYRDHRIGVAHIAVPKRRPLPVGVKSFQNIGLFANALEQELIAHRAGLIRRR